MTIEPSWILAGVAFLLCGILGVYIYITRRRPGSISDSAGELAEAHRAGAREKRDADYAAAVAVGARAVAEADAKSEEEVENVGSLADHLRDLGSE